MTPAYGWKYLPLVLGVLFLIGAAFADTGMRPVYVLIGSFFCFVWARDR